MPKWTLHHQTKSKSRGKLRTSSFPAILSGGALPPEIGSPQEFIEGVKEIFGMTGVYRVQISNRGGRGGQPSFRTTLKFQVEGQGRDEHRIEEDNWGEMRGR